MVVSHAGAGSVFEALRADKSLLVVVNDTLAGNHQEELAEALVAGNHAARTRGPVTDASVSLGFSSAARGGWVPLPPPDEARIVALADRLCGFTAGGGDDAGKNVSSRNLPVVASAAEALKRNSFAAKRAASPAAAPRRR